MSQLVACQWSEGMVMAADRRVETVSDGARRSHTLQKLFPLGGQAAVATSGAAVGIWVSRVLSHLMQRRASLPFRELEAYALSVFQREYEKFTAQGAAWFAAHPEAHRRSYVLLGGKEAADGFAFQFHASEEHGRPYAPLVTHSILAAPRRIGLETRLARILSAEQPDEGEVLETVIEGLQRASERDETVGGPFDAVVLSKNGRRWEVFPDPGGRNAPLEEVSGAPAESSHLTDSG